MATVLPNKPVASSSESGQARLQWWQRWSSSWLLAISLIIIGVLVVYGRSLGYGMYLDDNHHVRPWGLGEVLGTFAGPFDPLGIEPPYFRPLTVVTFALDWQIWGYNPWGYRLTNLILYALAAILVYGLTRRLFKAAPLALVAALFFIVIPSNAATAAYMSERCDALATIFTLLGLLALDNYRRSKRVSWLVGMNLAIVAAFMSKEIGAALPILLVWHSLLLGWRATSSLGQNAERKNWLEGFVSRGRATLYGLLSQWRTLLLIHGPAFALLAILLLYRASVLPKGEIVYDSSRNPLFGYVSAVYQTVRAVPWEVSPISSFVPLVLLVAALVLNRISRLWLAFGFGLVWISLACLPLAPLGRIEPRLLFLPSVGYTLSVAALMLMLVEWASQARLGRAVWQRAGLVAVLAVVLFTTAGWANTEGQDEYAPYSAKTLYHDEIIYRDEVMRAKFPQHNIKIMEEKLKHAGRL